MKRLADYAEMADEHLADFVAAGAHPAFEILVTRHHQRFYHMAYRWLMRSEDAEEAVQHCFMKLWSGQARWQHGHKARFTTWFYTILYHHCIDCLRQRSQPMAELEDVHASDDPSPETLLLMGEEQKRLQTILARLPERQRMALHLFYESGLKQKEIARIMELNIKALESLLTRAKQSIKEQWDADIPKEAAYGS